MTTRPKLLSSDYIVRFQHCDPLGHLNNSLYIDYFLNAREDQLSEQYQLNIYHHSKETGKAWVVASHQIQYKKPVNAMENITIESSLMKYDPKALQVKFEMKKADLICCTMETSFVYIDIKTGRPTEHSPELMELFETVCLQ